MQNHDLVPEGSLWLDRGDAGHLQVERSQVAGDKRRDGGQHMRVQSRLGTSLDLDR